MIGSSEDRAAGPVKADSRRRLGAMASLNRACPGLAHTRLPTSTSDSHHPFLQSNRLGENLKRCTKKALAKRWGVQTYRQLSGWNPPPLMIRAFRAHCQVETWIAGISHGWGGEKRTLDQTLCMVPVSAIA